MQIEELWDKIQNELVEIKTNTKELNIKIDNVEKRLDAKIDKVEKSLNAKIDKVEKRLDAKIDNVEKCLNAKVDNVKTELNEKFDSVNGRLDRLENKVDIMANVNVAKILEQQTQMRQELNNKIDQYMLQNNLEHKKFDYQIEKKKKENGVFTKIEE